MADLTPEDQAVLDAAEAYRDAYGATSGFFTSGFFEAALRLRNAVDARRKAREPKRCKHCTRDIEPEDDVHWVHRDSDIRGCGLVAEPDDSPAVEGR